MARPPAVYATPAELGRVSLDQLLAFAREYSLVDACRTEGDRLALYAGDDVIRLPERHAATFLAGMLRSRGWYLLEETHGPEAPPAEGVPPPRRAPAGDASEAVEAVLDALLAYAEEERLLRGYEKDAASRRVALRIPACCMVLSYGEALDFLFDCVQERACAVPA